MRFWSGTEQGKEASGIGMILWTVIGLILGFFLVLLWGKIKISFVWDGDQFRFFFHYFFIKKEIKGGKREKTEKKEPSKEKKKKKKRNLGGFFEIFDLLPNLIHPVMKFFELFLRYGKIPEMSITGEFGTGDPYYTGIGYGMAHSVTGIVRTIMPQFELGLFPNFTEEVYALTGKAKGEIRLGSLLLVLLVTFFYLPKRQILGLIRSR